MDPITLGIIALMGGVVFGAINTELGKKKRKEAQASLDTLNASTEAAEDADYQAFLASWQADLSDAQNSYEQLNQTISNQVADLENNLDLSAQELQGAYGADGQMGSEWASLRDLIVGDTQQRGTFEAAAGASGLRNTGTIANLQAELGSSLTENEELASRTLTAQMNSRIGTIRNSAISAQGGIDILQTKAATLFSDWGGFDQGAAGFSDTVQGRIFKAKAGQLAANDRLSDDRYLVASKENENTAARRWGDFFTGAGNGFNVIGNLFGTFAGVGG